MKTLVNYIKPYGFTLIEVIAVMALTGAMVVAMIIFFGPAMRVITFGRELVWMERDADWALSAINLNIREARSLEFPAPGVLKLVEVEDSNTYTQRYYLNPANKLVYRDRDGNETTLLPHSSRYQVSDDLSFTPVYNQRGAIIDLTLVGRYKSIDVTITGVKRFRN